MSWGGGETPALAGIVEAGRIDLAAACTGIVSPKSRLSVGDHLAPGDAIVLLASSGIHANGLSLARQLVERLPQGYLTPARRSAVPISFGEALLAPTVLYSPVTEALFRAGIRVRTTRQHHRPRLAQADAPHGRAHLPDPPAARRAAGAVVHPARSEAWTTREAYGTFNMGAGFAVFVPAEDAEQAVAVARKAGVDAWVAGSVEAGPRRLVIEPLGVEYAGSELGVRL